MAVSFLASFLSISSKRIEKLKRLEKEAVKEMDAVFKDISKKVKKKDQESIKSWFGDASAFTEYKGYKDGKILSSRGKIPEIHHNPKQTTTIKRVRKLVYPQF